MTKRPVVTNDDGSYSTVRSIQIDDDRGSWLLPTVIGDRVVSNDDAIHHFEQTGQNLGLFRSGSEADRYGQVLHQSQEMAYPDEPDRADEFLDALVQQMVTRRMGRQ